MNKNNRETGMGFVSALQLLLIALKILGKISWSWCVVLIPVWIELTFVIVSTIIMAIIAMKNSKR